MQTKIKITFDINSKKETLIKSKLMKKSFIPYDPELDDPFNDPELDDPFDDRFNMPELGDNFDLASL